MLLHVRKSNKGCLSCYCVANVLNGSERMGRTWRRCSTEVIDQKELASCLMLFIAKSENFYYPLVVVPEVAIVDALKGKKITDVCAEYECIIFDNTEGFTNAMTPLISELLDMDIRRE